MAKTRYRVCLIDDDAAFHKSFASEAKTAGYDTLGFDSAQAFLAGFQRQGVFCVVIASSLPDMNGLELLEALHKRKTPIPTIMVTRHQAVALAVQALKAGALDVLKIPVPPGVVADRLREAFAVWSGWQGIEQERQDVAQRLDLLSLREREVFRLLADGLKNTEIAQQLGIRSKTLDIHRSRVMAKMKARTTADIARWRLLLESGAGGVVTMKPGDYLG
jgi:FixJ family two-component response regulator